MSENGNNEYVFDFPPARLDTPGVYECKVVAAALVHGRYGPQIEYQLVTVEPPARRIRLWISTTSARAVNQALAAGLLSHCDGRVRFTPDAVINVTVKIFVDSQLKSRLL